MTTPHVSVVIPARNAEPWIAETIDAVLAQTCGLDALEVLVVDDGSMDATVEIARQRLMRGGVAFEILTGGNGSGPAATRNRGWRRARGAWIQFLDADDLIAPEKIAHQLAMASAALDDVALVFSPWGRLVERRHTWERATEHVRPVIGNDPLRDVIAPNNFIATGSQIFRRAWLERVGGYVETYRLLEDVDLLMRIVMAGGRIVEAASDAPLFWYRRHPTSASRRSRLDFAYAAVRNARTVETEWRRRDGTLSTTRARFLADVYFDAARVFADAADPAFEAITAHILALAPGFAPKAPVLLRELSRLVGYRRAERLAVRYRQLKRSLAWR